jgi:hypothetical protein
MNPNIRRAEYFVLSGTDRPGEVASILRSLTENKVDLEAMWGYRTSGGGSEIYLVPQNPATFEQTIQRMNLTVRRGTCFRITTPNKLGALNDTYTKLASAGINLQATQALAVGNEVGCYLWADDAQTPNIIKTLNAA